MRQALLFTVIAGHLYVDENYGPLVPISLYGASKLAGESLIGAFCHTLGIQAWCFRFANVVGSRLTHGVMYDFINKLRNDPTHLEILGDGKQQKPYVHVSDCVDGILFGVEHSNEQFNVFNIGPDSSTSVSTIANIIIDAMGLHDVKIEFTGGRQGWFGDVPQVRLDVTKTKKLGWHTRYNSDEAVKMSVKEMLKDTL